MGKYDAQTKWLKANSTVITIRLMNNSDADLLNYIEDKPTATVFKAALREYMKNHEGEAFVPPERAPTQKEIYYYVIGGQYEPVCYGGVNNITEAKRLAKKNDELWDNRQGWHRPSIYAAEDTIDVEDESSRAVKPDAVPIAWWDGKRWNMSSENDPE